MRLLPRRPFDSRRRRVDRNRQGIRSRPALNGTRTSLSELQHARMGSPVRRRIRANRVHSGLPEVLLARVHASRAFPDPPALCLRALPCTRDVFERAILIDRVRKDRTLTRTLRQVRLVRDSSARRARKWRVPVASTLAVSTCRRLRVIAAINLRRWCNRVRFPPSRPGR